MHNLLGKGCSRGPWLSGATVPVACPHMSPGAAAAVMAFVGQVGRVVWGVVLRTASSLFVQLTQHLCERPQIFLLFLFTFLLKHSLHTEKHTNLAAKQGWGPPPGINNMKVPCL